MGVVTTLALSCSSTGFAGQPVRRVLRPADGLPPAPPLIAGIDRVLELAANDGWQAVLQSLLDPAVADGGEQDGGRALRRFAQTQQGPFDDVILLAARQFGLEPFLFKGLLANESKLEPVRKGKRSYGERDGERVVVAGGARGIAQFSGGGLKAVQRLRQRRRERGEPALDFDAARSLVPSEAIFAAAELLAHLSRRYGRDGGITAYNAGIGSGRAVHRLGFWRARSSGKLHRLGVYRLQGYRFLLNVLGHANRLRRDAGLPALPPPGVRPAPPRVARRTDGPAGA